AGRDGARRVCCDEDPCRRQGRRYARDLGRTAVVARTGRQVSLHPLRPISEDWFGRRKKMLGRVISAEIHKLNIGIRVIFTSQIEYKPVAISPTDTHG